MVVERTDLPKPGRVEQVCPAVLELESIPGSWIFRIRLIARGCRSGFDFCHVGSSASSAASQTSSEQSCP
jgi:hypothetical protein